MKRAAALILLALSACSQEEPPASEELPSWSENLRAYCEAAQPGWLMTAISRIDRALPEPFDQGSVTFEKLNLQAAFNGAGDGDGNAGDQELQLRLTATRGGEIVPMSAYAPISEGGCALDQLELIEGYDRLNPPVRVAVPA